MPLAPDYVEADELKHALRIDDTVVDPEIGFAISAASRAIDAYCGRSFGKTEAAETRIFADTDAAALDGRGLVIDDVAASLGLVVGVDEGDDGTFGTTYAVGTDVRLWPWNAEGEGRPWTELRTVGSKRFPRRARAVQVTAQWGWPEVPALVKQACLIEALRLFKRKDAPFGVAGSTELGGAEPMRLLARLDPDVELLLAGLRRRWLAA